MGTVINKYIKPGTTPPDPPLAPLGRQHRALGYNIWAEITLSVTASDTYQIQQDLLDVLRQEYTADDCGVNATPGRNIPTSTQHSYLNFGTHSYWIVNWGTDLDAKKGDVDTAYTQDSLYLSSAYRNPAKQVSPPISGNANSYHVYGRAIDRDQGGRGYTGEEESYQNYLVWKAAEKTLGAWSYLRGSDGNDYGPDPDPPWPAPEGVSYIRGHADWR